MIQPPEVVRSAEQPTAVIRLNISREEIQGAMDPARSELFAALAEQNIEPAGPWFTRHFRRPADTLDFEVGVPVPRAVTASGRVSPGRLPATQVARSVYQGDYGGLRDAWGELHAWIEKEGLTPGEQFWEIYAEGPEAGGEPGTWRTELNRPLEPAP